ncbi:hypothetical protein RHMOL_Rhmol02G0243400 [Rhododendron molle]|uniref:Uncharacterized protein n=1 Tax=Rhododendron molle TaxID=49168 RepID=A0ACC0PU15_RHOML|nr:hypothetical protein RHMOL_Rhmol02G0243400 [Rhododendron molle]
MRNSAKLRIKTPNTQTIICTLTKDERTNELPRTIDLSSHHELPCQRHRIEIEH